MKNIYISCKLSNSLSGYIFSVEKNWYDFFEKEKVNLIPVNSQNFSENLTKLIKPSGIIIPGGNDIYKFKKNKINYFRDKFEYKLINYSTKKKIPLLGVCKGFQVIANFYNGKLGRCQNHVGTFHNLKMIKKSRFINLNKLNVNSFHNYGVTKLLNNFNVISKTDDQFIEIAEHRTEKILCFMFHPERYSKSQKKLKLVIKNFFKIR